MALETGTYISDLVITNPDGTVDLVSTADDHLRLIKSTIKNTFPNVNGFINSTPDDLSSVQYLVDSGASGAAVVTPNPAWSAYAAGKGIVFKAAADSTGAFTIKVNGLAATAAKTPNGQDPIIKTGGLYYARYDGSQFCILNADSISLINPLTINSGTSAGTNIELTVKPNDGGLGRGSQILFGASFNTNSASGDTAAKLEGSIQYIPNEFAGNTNARSHRLSFSTSATNTNTMTERLSILTGGNVGVGVTNPISTLDVNGTVSIEQKNLGGAGNAIDIIGNASNSPSIGLKIVNAGSNTASTAAIVNTVVSDIESAEQSNINLKVLKFGIFTFASKTYIITGAVWSGGSLKIYHNGNTTIPAGNSITVSGLSQAGYNGTFTTLVSPAPGVGYFYYTVADNGKCTGTLTDRLTVSYDGSVNIGLNNGYVGLGTSANSSTSVNALGTQNLPFRVTNGTDNIDFSGDGTIKGSGSFYIYSTFGAGSITLPGYSASIDFGGTSARFNGDVYAGGYPGGINFTTNKVYSATNLRARVHFVGGVTPTVTSSFFGTLSRNGAGDYTFTFTSNLPTANLSATGNIVLTTTLANQYLLYIYSRSASAISFKIINAAGTAVDTPDAIEVFVFSN